MAQGLLGVAIGPDEIDAHSVRAIEAVGPSAVGVGGGLGQAVRKPADCRWPSL